MLLDRILAKIEVTRAGCWQWTASTRGPTPTHQYGQIRVGRSVRQAHRVLWEILVGWLDADQDLDHLCRNTRCCNPDHLEPVSRSTNVRRGASPAAHRARQRRCGRGHPLAGENLIIDGEGHRHCRLCRTIHNAARDYTTEEYRRRNALYQRRRRARLRQQQREGSTRG